MRLATLEDARAIFKWRNHPEVRKFARNVGPISFTTHLAWIKNKFSDQAKTARIFVFELDNQRIGMTRIDKVGINTFEISIIIDPEYQGKGYGKSLLDMTASILRNEGLSCLILAFVHKNNYSSRKLFLQSGYVLADESTLFQKYEFNL